MYNIRYQSYCIVNRGRLFLNLDYSIVVKHSEKINTNSSFAVSTFYESRYIASYCFLVTIGILLEFDWLFQFSFWCLISIWLALTFCFLLRIWLAFLLLVLITAWMVALNLCVHNLIKSGCTFIAITYFGQGGGILCAYYLLAKQSLLELQSNWVLSRLSTNSRRPLET